MNSYFPKINKNPVFKKISSFDDKKKSNNLNNYDKLKNFAFNDLFIYGKKENSNDKQRPFNFMGNKKILEELEITKDIANTNPLLLILILIILKMIIQLHQK